jgi:protein phosphatase
LINLANLRGGLDNITALIVRIGPWVDPDSAESQHQNPSVKRDRHGSPPRSWRDRLQAMFAHQKPVTALSPEDEHRYRSSDCPIDESLIDRLSELTEKVREQAIEQAWSIDWSELASRRRKLAESRSANNAWLALRELGEIIALLGQAARFHRKSAGAANVP